MKDWMDIECIEIDTHTIQINGNIRKCIYGQTDCR